MTNSPAVECVSECFIRPKYIPEESKQPIYLSAWDLTLIAAHYDQKGLLFAKPPEFGTRQMDCLLGKLKDSLSMALVHFYPFAGCLATLKQEDPPIYSIYVDSTDSPGARFVHASVNLTIDDILSPDYVPEIVHSFFDHAGAINHDGHSLSLLTVQITDLEDGIFFGLSINHTIVDGTSLWHFVNIWSEIFKANGETTEISRPPIHKRWFPDGHNGIVNLPFTHPDQFISKFQAPESKDRFFHFSLESLKKLKEKANVESNTAKISTFQALSAHLWRCVTRARNFPGNQEVRCVVAINNRSRLSPPLSEDYVGNYVQIIGATATSGELLTSDGLGFVARKLHELVTNYTSKVALDWVESWVKKPFVYTSGTFPNTIAVGSSPRFDVYGSEFGLGKALAVRCGFGNKTDGSIRLFPGREDDGSIDVEVCLAPHSMSFLECDKEFVDTVS